MKEKKVSIILNSIIVILEIIALIISYKTLGRICIEYYTIDSNILALISSALYIIFLLKKNNIPRWLSFFKYLTTIGLSVTFVVVLFVLLPMTDFDLYGMLVSDSLIFHHVLCPILAIITFLFFDKIGKFSIKDCFFGLSFTVVYSIVLILLNYYKVLEGPYPFLKLYDQSVSSSILWLVIMYAIALYLSYLLKYFRVDDEEGEKDEKRKKKNIRQKTNKNR